MDKDFEILLNEAKRLINRVELNKYITYGGVASALMTDKGNIYTGVYIEAKCGIGFCAEHSAIADMIKHGETKIVKIVSAKKGQIYPPCGRCRELIRMLDEENLKTKVLLEDGKVVTIGELLPYPW
ncbi:MAG: cytidine deaminase [Bacilli bacterium]|nr:cytidine deaminase [Bacilli bacterium]